MARPPLQLKRDTQAAILAGSISAGEPRLATDTGLIITSVDGSTKYAAGSVIFGTDASRPSAGVARRLYVATDTGKWYLDDGATWHTANPDTGVDLKQLENNLARLLWEQALNDVMDDLKSDECSTQDDVDTGSSTALYDSGGDYYSKDAAGNIDLISNSWEASGVPTDAYSYLWIEEVDSITVGTDLKCFASMDDGSNYEELSTYERIDQGSYSFIRCEKSGLTSQSDQTMRLRVTGPTGKDFKVHAWLLSVKVV